MKIFHNNIPSSHVIIKSAETTIVPEQTITETVDIYEEAVPYILCELQSTIQHEAQHRADEEGRNVNVIQGRDVQRFEDFSSEGVAEPSAESAEESCEPPTEVSNVISINLYDLFERAKSMSNIDPSYLQDVYAGTPGEGIAGMYLMQDMPQGIAANPSATPYGYEGFDGRLWIDVRKQVQPWIVSQQDQNLVNPSTFQDDGIIRDVPGVSKQIVPSQGSGSPAPATPAAPAAPSIQAR